MLNPKGLQNGCEQHEGYFIRLNGKRQDMVQYDYRANNGKLFSCVARDLQAARQKRDNWLKENQLEA